MISLHRHFLQQYLVYSIISYSISYNSFHIHFIFYLIVVSIMSIYLFICFIILLHAQPFFKTFMLLSQLSHQFTILSVFGNFITCNIFSHFSYIHIRPLFNWFNLFWFLTHIDNSYFVTSQFI